MKQSGEEVYAMRANRAYRIGHSPSVLVLDA
jgi:hypothetical protein